MIKLNLSEIKKFLTQGVQEVAETCMNNLQVCTLNHYTILPSFSYLIYFNYKERSLILAGLMR